MHIGNSNGFIEVIVTDQLLQEALDRNNSFYQRFGNAGTHRLDKDRQRKTGYLAESAVKSACPRLGFSEDPSVHFVLHGVTFDVKAQGCNSPPKPDFVGTIYEEQKARETDFYIFTRVSNDFKKVWIAGLISKTNFFNKSKLISAGTTNNNFTYDQSRYEIKYSELISPLALLGIVA